MSARPINDGGPAFPIPGLHADAEFNGMSLRDYFAAKAMQSCLSDEAAPAASASQNAPFKEFVAVYAYSIADAMLAERANAGAA